MIYIDHFDLFPPSLHKMFSVPVLWNPDRMDYDKHEIYFYDFSSFFFAILPFAESSHPADPFRLLLLVTFVRVE